MKPLPLFAAFAIYLLCIACAAGLAWMYLHSEHTANEESPAVSNHAVAHKPYFSLSSNRTFGSSERARFYISYQAIDSLDFRVYRVNDPAKFFRQLANPHQMGTDEQEQEEFTATYPTAPTLLEYIREFKNSISNPVRNYFREKLSRETRTTVLEKVRGKENDDEESHRLPLNIADYARVPLLNPDQVVSTWREKLKPQEEYYDTRTIPLGKRDPGVYLVEAVNGGLRAYTIIVVTDLVTIEKISPDGNMLVYAVDRTTGAPREGIDIAVVKDSTTFAHGTTDHNGILKTAITQKQSPAKIQSEDEDEDNADEEFSDDNRNGYLITAKSNNDFSISDLDYFNFSGEDGRVKSFVYSDRPVYRPAQKVFFKGILRIAATDGYKMPAENSVDVTIEDPSNAKIFEKKVSLSPRGTFNGSVEIADGAPLGSYRIRAETKNGNASGSFEVLEYKKPEYKVAVKTEKQFVPCGEKATFTVSAKYFFGEPVANADVKYYIYRSRYYHWWWNTTADDDEFTDTGDDEDNDNDSYGYGNDMVVDSAARLDAAGSVQIEYQVPQANENDMWDYTYRLEAQVTDASRNEIDGKASFVGTRGTIVADANPDRWICYQGDNANIKIKTSDYEGHPVAANTTLKFVKRWWEKINTGGGKFEYRYQVHENEIASVDVSTSAQGEATYAYQAAQVGSVDIKIIVHEGTKSIPSHGGYLWVVDRNDKWGDFSYEESRSIKLVPDKQSYQPGDTAHVLAMLPEEQTHLLVTTELMNIFSVRQLDVASREVMLDVPIDASFAPDVYLSVAYVKDGDMYSSDKLLGVPAKNKMLKLEITSDKQIYKPGESVLYTVASRNADGTPAAGVEISLGVVDEAIYSIRPDNAGDIRREFYGRRYDEVRTMFSTSYWFTGHSGSRPMQLASTRKAYQLADFKNDNQYVEPTIRKLFKDTAFWIPDLLTNASGTAATTVVLPDNLTTWRATARGVTADLRVGAATEKIVERKNLILRMETPRFLTEGDVATFSAVVHNYLDDAKQAKIELQLTGAEFLDSSTKIVSIAKQGESRVDWRVAATHIGEIKLLAKALTNEESDAVELPLKIFPHGLMQTNGASATLSNENAEQTIELNLPADAHAQARTLRIEASPSIAGALFGSLDYLTSFPWGCTEQTMSSFLPNVIVTQALRTIKSSKIRETNDLPKKVERGLDRLYAYQHGDGGWGWWKDDNTDQFMTAYVVDGLTKAKLAGYEIDQPRLSRARRKILSLLDARPERNAKVDPEYRMYLLYAFMESSPLEPAPDAASNAWRVDSMFAHRAMFQPYGMSMLALTLHQLGDGERSKQIASELEASAHVTDFDAHWDSKRTTMYDVDEDIGVEATALALNAIAQISPKSLLLPKIARWLVNNRQNGYYWSTTKQTAFAIFGLTEYLKVSKELSPDYTFEIFVNGRQVLTHHVNAADATSGKSFAIVRDAQDVSNSNTIRIVKHGRGMMYVSGTLRFFTTGDRIESSGTAGLALTREYLQLRVTQKDGRAVWSVEPFSGDVRSGDLIVSRLHVKGDRGQYMIIDDPIPAGCEQIERASGINFDYSDGHWCNWYSNREFRDQRTAFFLHYFSGDEYFQYAMRVIEPGEFRIPPARAEFMYQPQVHANSSNAKMKITDR